METILSREPKQEVGESCHLWLNFDDGTLSACQALCRGEKKRNKNVTAGVRHRLGSSGYSQWHPKVLPCPCFWHRTCSFFWGCIEPVAFGLLLTSPLCLSTPMKSTCECLISTLICKIVPFRIYVSGWGTEEELINSVSGTGVGPGIYGGKPRQMKGQVKEVIAGCVECHCVHSKNNYVFEYVHVHIEQMRFVNQDGCDLSLAQLWHLHRERRRETETRETDALDE